MQHSRGGGRREKGAFDVLIWRGKNLLNVPLAERRKVLAGVFKSSLKGLSYRAIRYH
jgi:ATP-dependent DNA ligase